jgi:hypothetical protein
MMDPFEQTLVLPNADALNQAPAGRSYKDEKHFFKRPPYIGAPPRVFQPVVHL